MTFNPEDLVSEDPVEFDGQQYTARRNPGENRWQVFGDAFAPVGYLEAVYQPTETLSNGGWQIAVFDSAAQQVGEPGKRDAPGTVPAVDSYEQALHWLWARGQGLA
jgi:hypothetical protein